MMQRLDGLRAELAAVESLLAEARSVNDPVGILQYGQRRDELLKEVNQNDANLRRFDKSSS